MERITIKHLRAVCDRLNRITDSPMTPYARAENGVLQGQIGNFHISRAYGGFELCRIVNEGGGVTCPIGSHHRPARELYDQMHAFIAGIELGKD